MVHPYSVTETTIGYRTSHYHNLLVNKSTVGPFLTLHKNAKDILPARERVIVKQLLQPSFFPRYRVIDLDIALNQFGWDPYNT